MGAHVKSCAFPQSVVKTCSAAFFEDQVRLFLMGTNIPKTTLLDFCACSHNLLNKYEERFLAYSCV